MVETTHCGWGNRHLLSTDSPRSLHGENVLKILFDKPALQVGKGLLKLES